MLLGSATAAPKKVRMVGRVGETMAADGRISVLGADDPDGNRRIRRDLRLCPRESGSGEIGVGGAT